MKGKHTCGILRQIRQEIALANDISLVTKECKYKGDCTGTCPLCEEEVRYLESELAKRSRLGRKLVLAGLSSGLFMNVAYTQDSTLPFQGQNRDVSELVALNEPDNIRRIKGYVYDEYGPVSNAYVEILNSNKPIQMTDSSGCFVVEVHNGQTICVTSEGMETVKVTENTPDTLAVMMYAPLLDGGSIAIPFEKADDLIPVIVPACHPKGDRRTIERDIASFPELSGLEVAEDVTVKISFVVDKGGNVKDIKMKKSTDKRFDEVALRVFRANFLYNWSPRRIWNTSVDSKNTLRVVFHVNR